MTRNVTNISRTLHRGQSIKGVTKDAGVFEVMRRRQGVLKNLGPQRPAGLPHRPAAEPGAGEQAGRGPWCLQSLCTSGHQGPLPRSQVMSQVEIQAQHCQVPWYLIKGQKSRWLAGIFWKGLNPKQRRTLHGVGQVSLFQVRPLAQ